jgi:2-polyprenyl-3-methyl-5-hydroxy-6-metoxy-1,4-benzoquinol methylase
MKCLFRDSDEMHGSETNERELWDKWNAGGGPQYPRDEVVRFFMRRYKDKVARKNTRVLDLGCGGGVHTAFLAAEGFNTSACDISPEGVEITKKRLADRGLSANVFVSSIETLDLKPVSFDAILSVGVLECTLPGAVEAEMPKIARLLRPGGVGFFIFASNRDYRLKSEKNPYVRRGFTEGEVRSIFGMSFDELDINRVIRTEQNQSIELNEWMVAGFIN